MKRDYAVPDLDCSQQYILFLCASFVRSLAGFADVAKHAAQGAALIADGLAGGHASTLVEALGIREARGTVLDYLYVVDPAAARARLGIP